MLGSGGNPSSSNGNASTRNGDGRGYETDGDEFDPLDVNDTGVIDASKLNFSEIPTKTPVSVLQEILSRRGATAKYELVQIEGAIHEPTFRYRVTVGDTLAVGTGKSKKEAKHAAARNLLDRMIGQPALEERYFVPANIDHIPSHIPQQCEKITGNPIGTLQEMCISNKWPPPSYEMTQEEGLPHERQFTITCMVYIYRETGCGKSKKLAKRQAAFKMWERLVSGAASHNPSFRNGVPVQSAADRYADLKNAKIPTLTPSYSQKVSMFHRNLRQSTGEKIKALQSMPLNAPNMNYVEILQGIATEQRFEVTYVDVEEKSFAGKCQCLVQLSSLPVAVCYGSDVNPKEAQAVAAHNALEYLKIMTKG